MDDTHAAYTDFHSTLGDFITHLKDVITSDAPGTLQDVDVVTQILGPNDSAFSDKDTENVIKKVYLTMDFTNLILENVGQFINGDSQEWLDGQKTSVGFYITIVTMSLATLRWESEDDDIDEVSNGLGGINKGAFNEMLDTSVLKKIKDIVQVLKS